MPDRPQEPALTFDRGCAQLLGCILAFAGILVVLRTGVSSVDNPAGRNLMFLTAHFLTGVTFLIAGLAGIACAVSRRRARPYLSGLAALCVLWAVLAVVLHGDPNDMFARDAGLITMLLTVALAALAGVVWHHSTVPQAVDPPID